MISKISAFATERRINGFLLLTESVSMRYDNEQMGKSILPNLDFLISEKSYQFHTRLSIRTVKALAVVSVVLFIIAVFAKILSPTLGYDVFVPILMNALLTAQTSFFGNFAQARKLILLNPFAIFSYRARPEAIEAEYGKRPFNDFAACFFRVVLCIGFSVILAIIITEDRRVGRSEAPNRQEYGP